MSPKRHHLMLAVALLAGGCGGVDATGPVVVPSAAELGQGKHMRFRVFPSDAPIEWSNLSGPDAGYVSPSGSYHAPLKLAAERTVTLQASDRGRTTRVQVLLKPGPVATSDCLAPGQPVEGSGQYDIEELPEAIVRVNPVYPDAARNAGIQGTVMLQAFVCACGEVSDVRVVLSIPGLDQASIDAVHQWVFKPALSNREPVAVWVGVPVKFTLH